MYACSPRAETAGADGIVRAADARRDHPSRALPGRGVEVPGRHPRRAQRRRARADRSLRRRAQDHAALFDLQGAEAPALPHPPQGRSHRRARRAGQERRTRRPGGLRLEPPQSLRLPGGAAGARRQRRPAAHHCRRHQPVRRPARVAAPPRDRRHSDPAQHARPGVPDHAQGLRGGAAAQARLLLLPGRRPQLQRRAEAPQDRADAGGAAGRAPAHDAGADRGVLRPGARGSHPGEAGREADAAPVQPRARRDGALRRGLSLPGRTSPSASRFRSPAWMPSRAAPCSI